MAQNYVGLVQHYLHERGFTLANAIQEAHISTGPPHAQMFTYTLTYQGINTVAFGTSIKEAKQNAFRTLWQELLAMLCHAASFPFSSLAGTAFA